MGKIINEGVKQWLLEGQIRVSKNNEFEDKKKAKKRQGKKGTKKIKKRWKMKLFINFFNNNKKYVYFIIIFDCY